MLATCTLFSTYSHQFTKSVQSNVFALKELQDKISSGEEEGDPSEAWKKIGIEKQEEILGKFVFNFDHHSKVSALRFFFPFLSRLRGVRG